MTNFDSSLVDFTGYVREDGSAILHGRLTDQDKDRTLLTSDDISSITYSIFEKDNKSVVIADSVALTLSEVIATVDSHGDNFHFRLPSDSFPKGNRIYRVEFTILLANGYTNKSVGELYAIETGTGTAN